jgi:tetratricopeptide (TPR) repeat protein
MRTSHFFLSVFLGLTTGLCRADCDPAGRLDGIKAEDLSRITLSRGQNKIDVANGMVLCSGDLISVSADASVILSLGKTAETQNKITLYGGTTTEVSAPDSIFLRLGRIFASLQAPFSAGTVFGRLGAHGTSFEIEASEQETTIWQLEGQVDFLASGSVSFEQRPSPSVTLLLVSMPQETHPEKSLPSLTQFSIRRDRKPESKPVDQQTCAGLVRRNSDTVISTRPKLPSVITDTALMLKWGGFGPDRQRSICTHDTRSFVDVARVYVAWNQPADAVHYVRKSGIDPVRDISDPFTLNDLGNAFRLAGDLDYATTLYRAAMSRDASFAFPYNGLGDVYRDRALIAYGHNRTDEARSQLAEAMKSYLEALQRRGKEAGPNRSIGLYNLGEADLLHAIMEPDSAEQNLSDAQARFREAISQSGGSFPFAEVGLARILLVRAQLVQVKQEPGIAGAIGAALAAANARKPILKDAENQLRPVIARYPDFSFAVQTLGEIKLHTAMREAVDLFRRATQLDPHNGMAYLWLSRVERHGSDRKLYAAVSEQVQTQTAIEISQGRIAMARHTVGPGPINEVEPEIQPEAKTAILSTEPSSLTFGAQSVADRQSVRLINSGSKRVSIRKISLDAEPEFRILSDQCSGRNLGPSESCAIVVQFDPHKNGNFKGVLIIQHNGSNSPSTVQISGARNVIM